MATSPRSTSRPIVFCACDRVLSPFARRFLGRLRLHTLVAIDSSHSVSIVRFAGAVSFGVTCPRNLMPVLSATLGASSRACAASSCLRARDTLSDRIDVHTSRCSPFRGSWPSDVSAVLFRLFSWAWDWVLFGCFALCSFFCELPRTPLGYCSHAGYSHRAKAAFNAVRPACLMPYS